MNTLLTLLDDTAFTFLLGATIVALLLGTHMYAQLRAVKKQYEREFPDISYDETRYSAWYLCREKQVYYIVRGTHKQASALGKETGMIIRDSQGDNTVDSNTTVIDVKHGINIEMLEGLTI